MEGYSLCPRTHLHLTPVKDTSAKVVIIGVPAPFTATCTNQVRPHSKSRFNICFENQVSPFHFCIESTLQWGSLKRIFNAHSITRWKTTLILPSKSRPKMWRWLPLSKFSFKLSIIWNTLENIIVVKMLKLIFLVYFLLCFIHIICISF